MSGVFIDYFIFLTYLLFFVALILIIFFGIKNIISNYKTSQKTIIALLGLILIYVFFYILSSEEVYEKFNIGPKLSKAIGAGLYMLYFIMFISMLSIIITEIKNYIKR